MNNRKKVFDKLDSLNALKSPPSILTEVLPLIDQESLSTSELSAIILKNPDFAARILRKANSLFYGHQQEITSVDQAIKVVGRNMVKRHLLSISIYDRLALKDSGNSRDLEKLWQHLLETAVAAKDAARIVNYGAEDEAYAAGLLHDFGRVILLQYFPGECDEIYRLSAEEKFLIDAEREILDTDHQEIGHHIAEQWNLPQSLSEIIGNHHPVDEVELNAYPQLAGLVIFADNISPTNFEYPDSLDGTGRRISVLDTVSGKLGLSMDEIKNICCDLSGEVVKNAEGFGLNPGDAFEYLSRANRKLYDLYLGLAGAFREKRGLSGNLSQQERMGSIHESLNIALATLSHYINNATMNISGQCEVMQMLYERNDREKFFQKMPAALESVKSSIRKISIILEELSVLSNFENVNYLKDSNAIDIEAELRNRLDSSQVLI
jgi:putative nucleotidyltransferase with HDIG domain